MKELIISEELTKKFAEWINQKIGLSYNNENKKELKRKLIEIIQKLHFKDPLDFYNVIVEDKLNQDQLNIIFECLTINETYFFRDKALFNVLEKKILPELIARETTSREIRIWCCACSTGEEIYSIAILLHKLIYNFSGWNIQILGTDIDNEALKKAQLATYGDWSFRGIDPLIKNQYFSKNSLNKYLLTSSIKSFVSFKQLNLIEEPYPSGQDLILCCNVLIYFSKEMIAKVVKKIAQVLNPEGFLFTSAAETPLISLEHFELINAGSLIYFKKRSQEKKHYSETIKSDFKQNSKSSHYQKIDQPNLNFEQKVIKSEQLIKKEYYEEAIVVLLELLQEKPLDLDIISSLIQNYLILKKYDEALVWCEKALFYKKLELKFYYFRSVIFFEKHLYEKSLLSLKQSLFINPSFVMGYYLSGFVYKHLNRQEEAYKAFLNALKLLNAMPENEIVPFSEETKVADLKKMIEQIL